MKMLVLGGDGMLGHMVQAYFKEKGYDVYATSRKDGSDIYFDAENGMEKINDILDLYRPNVIINCIGILNKVAEDNKVLAVKVNSLLPHYIDSVARKRNIKFVHVSTDCVYEGTIGNYKEDSVPDATSFYGRSKALGEVNNEESVTLRTSIVGPDNNEKAIGLFKWFITQSGSISGYSKVLWTGVTTLELSKCIEIAIKENLNGLHHVVNNTTISKYELLCLFKDIFNKNIEINQNNDVVSEKTLIRTEKSYSFDIPSYKKMVEEMKEWVLNHENLYPLIFDNCNIKKRKLD